MTTLHERFAAQAARTPDAIALTFRGESLTYGALNARANQLAHTLLAQGVTAETLVALLMDRSFEMVIGILGILKAGGAYVPLDPTVPEERLRFQLADSAAPVLVTRTGLPVPPSAARVIALDTLPSAPTHDPVSPSRGENLAYVIYTSGSTGQPKGCLVEHRNVLPLFENPAFAVDERDVWTLFHSYAFDFSVWELWGALLFGGRLVIPTEPERRAADAFHALLKREGVTILNQSPTAFAQLIVADEKTEPLTALRTVLLAAEKLDVAILKPWFARYGDERPAIWNCYGITETTVHVAHRQIRVADTLQSASPLGLPFPGWTLSVVEGELYVGGVGVTRGYLNRPELTAQRFVEHEGQRVYRSGDLVRVLESGELDYIGRADLQVKLRGHRIELGEIESVLTRFPGVRAAAVVLHDERLVGFTIGAVPDPTALARFAREHLPVYMVPSAFVALDAFPMTANDKLDRRALLALSPSLAEGAGGCKTLAEGAGGCKTRAEGAAVSAAGGASNTASVHPPAPSASEGEILALWQRVIGTTATLTAGDVFFDIGGHSLLLPLVRDGIRERFGVELSLIELFEYPTARALAERVRQPASPPQNGGIRERALRQREAAARLRRH